MKYNMYTYENYVVPSLSIIEKLGGFWIKNACIVPEGDDYLEGVYDQNGLYIPYTGRRRLGMGGFIDEKRQLSNKEGEVLKGKSLYLGVMFYHYGHMLVDSSSRLWSLGECDVYENIVMIGNRNRSIPSYHKELFAWLNINKKMRIIDSRIVCEQLYVPDMSYLYLPNKKDGYDGKISYKFYDTFLELVHKVGKSKSNRKIFFSRTGHVKKYHLREWGNELLDRLFALNGYEIVNPLDYSLFEQIQMLSEAGEFVSTVGTSAHNAVWAINADRIVIINRYNSGLQVHQMALDMFANYKVDIIDAFDYKSEKDVSRIFFSKCIQSYFEKRDLKVLNWFQLRSYDFLSKIEFEVYRKMKKILTFLGKNKK